MKRSLGWALAALACTVTLAACVEFVLFAQLTQVPTWVLDEFAATGLVYAAAGITAWWLRPSNGTGPIMVLGALSWLLAGLFNTTVPVLVAVGTVTATLPVAVVVHLLLAFPSGRLRSVHARALAAAGYFTALVLQIPLYLFVPQPAPYDVLAVADRPDLAHAGKLAQDIVGGLGMLAVVAILAARIGRADRAGRRILLPLYVYSVLAVLIIPLGPDVLVPLTGISPIPLAALQVGVLAGVPVAFAAGVLAGRFARMSEVHELGAWLGAAEPGRPPLERALARALGDESVRLAFWVPARSGYVDALGRPVALPGPHDPRAAAAVTLGERPIGAITYDPMLIADAELVRAAGQVVALAVDRERLTAELLASKDELLASRDQLRLSRARLAEAADAERRRIAQDLHDGVQAKLVLLALEADRAGAPALRDRIDATAAELRELVHRVMPAALIERGLAAAAADLADRSPLPVVLDNQLADTLPDHVASTAYFVLAEGLANALRHAQASALGIRLASRDGVLTVEVSDDGVGLTHSVHGEAAGSQGTRGLGLPGLADRVDAAGGRLRMESPDDGGTRLVAELPCA